MVFFAAWVRACVVVLFEFVILLGRVHVVFPLCAVFLLSV